MSEKKKRKVLNEKVTTMITSILEPDDFAEYPYMDLIDSIRKGDADRALDLLNTGVGVFPPQPLAAAGIQPAVIEAALAGRHDIFEMLLNRSPNVLELLDQCRLASLLHCVCLSNHLGSLSLLINQHDEIINAEDVDEMTALHYAAYSGSVGSCRVLVEAGIDAYKKSTDGITALMTASSGGHVLCVKFLARLEDMVDIQDEKGRTALMYAAANKRENTIRILLECSADPAICDFESRNALHLACYAGSLAGVLAILQANIDLINVTDKFGETPLLIASRRGFLDIVTELIKQGGDINAVNKCNMSSLCVSALMGHEPVVMCILESKPDLSIAESTTKRTALHFAAMGGNESIVSALLQHGAKDCQDAEGKFAKDYA